VLIKNVRVKEIVHYLVLCLIVARLNEGLLRLRCFGLGWSNDYRLKNIPNEAAAERRARNFAVFGEYKGIRGGTSIRKQDVARKQHPAACCKCVIKIIFHSSTDLGTGFDDAFGPIEIFSLTLY
jgi:hypothetical protein